MEAKQVQHFLDYKYAVDMTRPHFNA